MYRDDYTVTFNDEEQMFVFLEKEEEQAEWSTAPVEEIRVSAIDEASVCGKSDHELEVLKDTLNNTGLLLKVNGKEYPVGISAMNTLKDRARIKGNALRDIDKVTLARILNDCLDVAKGKVLLKLSYDKVRAAHAGDANDYGIFPMRDLLQNTVAYVQADYSNSKFALGYYDHGFMTATWLIKDDKLLKSYKQQLCSYGMQDINNMNAAITIESSDVAKSSATIRYQLYYGEHRVALGRTIKLMHKSKNTMSHFAGNLNATFSVYKQAIKGLSKLLDIQINYPLNCMGEILKYLKIPKKYASETMAKYEAIYGVGPCNAHQLYIGICDCIDVAASDGAKGKALAEMEERIASCLQINWIDYDLAYPMAA